LAGGSFPKPIFYEAKEAKFPLAQLLETGVCFLKVSLSPKIQA
jgi:hypothetical protein